MSSICQLNCNGSFDVGVGFVIFEREILEFEAENVFYIRVDAHLREGEGFTGKLLLGLFQMVGIEVGVAQSMHEIAKAEAADLRDHHGQKRVGGDVERHAEKDVGGALVKLAR